MTGPTPCHVAAVFLAISSCTMSGCGESSPTQELSADDKVLLALDSYNPIYKLDADGRVVNMRLEGPHVTAVVLAEIGKLTELRGISLYGASLTDDSLAHLKDLQNLTNIGLGGTPITDKAILHLEKLRSLRQIWLPRSVSQQAAENLKAALPGLTVHPQ